MQGARVAPASAQQPTRTSVESGSKRPANRDTTASTRGANEDNENEEIITGITHARRIVLTKRNYLLLAFVFVTALGTAGIIMSHQQINKFGLPPTLYSAECVQNTLYAMIYVTAVTPLGFILLKFRIANLLIGFVYMYALVLCLIYPMKSVINSAYCLNHDTEFNIHTYVSDVDREHLLNEFWDSIQREKSCCGTKEIDRVNDWPYFLDTEDFPSSCCTDWYKSEITSHINQTNNHIYVDAACGKGLGRTRTKGFSIVEHHGDNFKRIFSGIFTSLSIHEIDKLEQNPSTSEDTDDIFSYLSDLTNSKSVQIRLHVEKGKEIGEMKLAEAYSQVWKNFYIDSVCNAVEDLRENYNYTKYDENYEATNHYTDTCTILKGGHPNDIMYQPNMKPGMDPNIKVGVLDLTVPSIREQIVAQCINGSGLLNASLKTDPEREAHCRSIYPEFRDPVVTLGRELMLVFDYMTEAYYELYAEDKVVPHEIRAPLLWHIPTNDSGDIAELYPYQLRANLERVQVRTADKLQGQRDVKLNSVLKKMYYVTTAIAENIVLQHYIHADTCESLNSDYREGIQTKIARDMNRRFRKSGPLLHWKNKEEGLGQFFLERVHFIAWVSLGVSLVCVLCVIVIAIIFWQYYSRIKAEEYANLALPKEFEVLHLRRGSGIDAEDIVEMRRKPGKGGRRLRKTAKSLAYLAATLQGHGHGHAPNSNLRMRHPGMRPRFPHPNHPRRMPPRMRMPNQPPRPGMQTPNQPPPIHMPAPNQPRHTPPQSNFHYQPHRTSLSFDPASNANLGPHRRAVKDQP